MENVTLGEYLKREREKKGYSLDKVAEITRIRKAYLVSIENNDFSFQSPVFLRGFLRSYADCLGIDSAEVLKMFKGMEEAQEAVEEKPAIPVEPAYKAPSLGKYLIPAGIALFIAFAFFALRSRGPEPTKVAPVEKPSPELPAVSDLQQPVSPQEMVQPAITTVRKQAAFRPATTTLKKATPVAEPKPVVAAVTTPQTKKRHTLVISAKEMTWLKIALDDQEATEALLNEGERISYGADHRISILLGNAGGVDLTLNGKQLQSLGPSGAVVSKIFTNLSAIQ